MSAAERRQIADALGREPTTVELRAFDAQWSEHCSYKSSRRHLRRLPVQSRDVVLGPGEDAGILHLGEHEGERYGVVVAHESHNHPSQVVPFEGAATGVGGIVRDVLCMGAQVVGIADALRFGDVSKPDSHERHVAQAVVDGISEYGNAIGVPNLAGDVYFHEGFNENCLVNVIALGLVKESEIVRSFAPPQSAGWPMLLVGKATDASGFGGASFSSLSLDVENESVNKGAVQVPDPFLKNVLMRATYRVFDVLRERGVTAACKDLGAGGVMGCSAEICAAGGFGARIDLDRLNVAQEGLPPEVLAVGETQERMLFVVPPQVAGEVMRIYNEEFSLPQIAYNARAVIVGEVTSEKRYVLTHHGKTVMDVDIELLATPPELLIPSEASGVEGPPPGSAPNLVIPGPSTGATLRVAPLRTGSVEGLPPGSAPNLVIPGPSTGATLRVAPLRTGSVEGPLPGNAPNLVIPSAASEASGVEGPLQRLATLLSSLDGCSREPLYRRYDSVVRGCTVIPRGYADAGVIAPIPGSPLGVAVAVAGNPRYGAIDPRLAAEYAVLEAVRKVVAVGARPIGLTDCLNFGNPNDPQHYGEFVAAVDGLEHAARELGLPFVSGNVSFYNESSSGKAIPASAIVACIGAISDIGTTVGHSLKHGAELVYVGRMQQAMAGAAVGGDGAALLSIDYEAERKRIEAVLDAISSGAVCAAKATGAGGMLPAVAEMAFASRLSPGPCLEWLDAHEPDLDAMTSSFAESGGWIIALSPLELLGVSELNWFYDFAVAHGLRYPEDYHNLGCAFDDVQLCLPEEKEIDLGDLFDAWQKRLAEIYP